MSNRTTKSKSSPEHLAARVNLLQQRVRKLDADAILITNKRDIRYLTGFSGDDSWAVVLARSARVQVISDFRFAEEIAHVAPQVAVTIREGPISDALAKLQSRLGFRRLALQADRVTLSQHKVLRKKLAKAKLLSVDDGLLKQRAVKDAGEVAQIRAALKIQQQAFRDTLETISPGDTERQIAASLEFAMRSLGADGTSFPSIVAADANGSLPHAVPGDRKIKKGSTLLVDWGAKVGGYCSDLTRVVAFGKMAPKLREIYKVVLDAQMAAIDAIAPGKSLKAVDDVARGLIIKAGYGDHFGHGLGHGIGLDIHEQPTLSPRSEGVLEVGQVVTVEPGIYLPGVGGVRIEDDVLVTPKGQEVLSDLPKDLESAII